MIKIGDEISVHGYVDEIRHDTIIIRNNGGYFGTIETEIRRYHKPFECACDECRYHASRAERRTDG